MATEDQTPHESEHSETPEQRAAMAAARRVEESDGQSAEELKAARAEIERLKKAQAETNRKALADRKRLEDIERDEREREDAKLGETERLKKLLAEEAEQRREAQQALARKDEEIVELRINSEIQRQAVGLFEHPEIAPRLIDRDRVVYDRETGKITGIKDALDRVLKDYPGMALARRGGGSPAAMRTRRPGLDGGQSGGTTDPGLALRDEMNRIQHYEPM